MLLLEIIKNHAFQKVMFLLTQETFIEAELNERKLIMGQASLGFHSSHRCDICQAQDGLLIHYNSCGHEVHPSCGQDVKACVICIASPASIL